MDSSLSLGYDFMRYDFVGVDFAVAVNHNSTLTSDSTRIDGHVTMIVIIIANYLCHFVLSSAFFPCSRKKKTQTSNNIRSDVCSITDAYLKTLVLSGRHMQTF